ncbi:hypothetical protein Psch_00115 [Pelotomaculum schinkii]|uniref:Glycosyltransferase RgtA/B/C/D-like domain-containing protein n=1 Tax=Pelotomaculum schinkii TaxID=78350 RepID=A0A4Y7RCX6_9FIRM|nr:hypothetical protein [Pelotomaculum schinkii]TEB06583.1 hypothetical protein Psch_00115 [Pelotomaculum schinkii]
MLYILVPAGIIAGALTNENLLMIPLLLVISAAILLLAGIHHVPVSDRKFLFLLALGALLIRLILIVSTHCFETSFIQYVKTSDAIYYEQIGRLIAEAWHNGTHLDINKNNFGYQYWNGIIYYFAGFKPDLIIIINSIASVCTGLNLYFIALKLSGSKAAKISYTLAIYFPSAILWSSLNLKDSLVIFLITLIVKHTLELIEEYKLGRVLFISLLLMALVTMRFYAGILIAVCIALSYIFAASKFPWLQRIAYSFAIVIIAGFVLQQMGYGFMGTEYILSQSFETIGEQHQNAAYGEGAFAEDVQFDSFFDALKYLPVGVVYFLFAPFPWQSIGAIRILAVPEMIFLYFLYSYFIAGFKQLWRTQRGACLFLLLFILTFGLIYSLGSANIGGIYRVRLQVIMVALLFISEGMQKSWALNKIFGRFTKKNYLMS